MMLFLHDLFPTPFTNEVLESVGGKEIYSFTNGFYGYHQIKLVEEDWNMTTFVTEWCCFHYMIIPFGLKNAPAIFSRIVVAYFKEFTHKFLEDYFDNWTIYELIKDHIESLHMVLKWFQHFHISLNLNKCIFCVPFGILLGHVVCREGMLMDPVNITIIVDLPPPSSIKKVEDHAGSYWLLQEIYQRICKDHGSNGKFVVEGCKILVEWRMSK